MESDEVVDLRPDRDHPVSQGFACVKGTRFHTRVQHHPDRVLSPMLRNEGVLKEASWDTALARLGGELRALRREHGKEAIALYSGNAAGHALGAVLGLGALQRGLGTHRHYSCLTLDNSEMFVVAEEVFGSPLCTFVADYSGSDGILLVGTDPLSSMPSQAQSNPRGPIELRAAADRLWVVDPRRSDTAAKAALHLQNRPGSDVYLLGWLLREVLAAGRQAPDPAETDVLAARVAVFDLATACEQTGCSPSTLLDLAKRLLAAERPLVWSGLGVLLGPQGTLGWWLTVCLQAVLCGLDTEGGWRWQPGPIGLPTLGSKLGLRGRSPSLRTTDGRFPAVLDTLAAATLADDILDGHVRALLVFGGDPLRALPDSRRAQRALEKLSLLVSVDLFVNHTGELAHAVLPAATWLERTSAGLHTSNQRRTAHHRVDAPVVNPRGKAKTDWQIAAALCRAAGRPLFGSRLADLALRPVAEPAALLERAVGWLGPPRTAAPRSWSGRARLAVPEFLDALDGLPLAEASLRLVTSVRPLASMNHWIRAAPTAASAHPDTLSPGRYRLEGPAGALETQVASDATLARDVVVLPFGGETNPNVLISTTTLEPFTGQPISNGTPIRAIRIGKGEEGARNAHTDE